MNLDENLLFSVMDGDQEFTRAERLSAIDDALSFEECNYTEFELLKMNDRELSKSLYGIWADYARGQL